jgi:hypothetical protein
MKWRKIMDGVYEGESFEPEIVGPYVGHHEIAPDKFAKKLWGKVLTQVGMAAQHYHYSFSANSTYYQNGYDGTPNWHIDGGDHYNCDGYTHLLILVACDDPTLGTEVGNLNDGSVFRCKTWTPYLIHGRMPHRSPPDGGKAARVLYRWYVNPDLAALPT